jgi:CheY-like chemotaxis protein
MNYNWNDKTLLIVEDDHINYKYLEILLLRTNVTVLRALDGQQAVDLCRNHPEIDVVLMDIQLPILNGYDATKKIKAFRGDLPIIAQTANAMDDDKDKCLNAGCDDYLTKPISHEVLFNLLDDIFKMKYHIS